jgi:ketosteroid isomerase-like protein
VAVLSLSFCLPLSGCGGTLWNPARAPDPQRDRYDADYTEGGVSLTVYHNAVRSKVMAAFTALNRGDAEPALATMSDNVVYEFEGQHALGGTRHSKRAVRRWFGRLLYLIPSKFMIRQLEVSGWPWNTRIYLQFEDRVTPCKGAPYLNRGVQISYLRWGEVYYIHTYVNTSKLERALNYMIANGIPEAGAPPIGD